MVIRQIFPANFTRSRITAWMQKTEQIDYDALAKAGRGSAPGDDHRRALRLIRAFSIFRGSGKSPTQSTRFFSSTWRTSRASSPAGEHPSPMPHAQFVTTTTHKSLRGPRGGIVLCEEQFAKADRLDAFFPGCKAGRSCT